MRSSPRTRAFAALACVGLAGLAAVPAEAALIGTTATSATLNGSAPFGSFNTQFVGNGGGAALNTTIAWTQTGWTSNSASFAITVTNNSSSQNNRLVSFGVDVISPTLTGASADSGWGHSINSNFPGFQSVNLCVWDGNNCQGGANPSNGVFFGAPETLNLTLNFANGALNPPTNLVLTGFLFRWQSAADSFTAEGCVGASCNPPPPRVPEPATLALLGLGLLGAGFASRRRRG